MNRMLISVIICTYKRVDATRQLLRCLAAQTYRPFEVLVVDGSGDRCGTRAALAETIRELSDRMDVRLIESAKGLTVQRNVGIDLAAGEIVAFFDDDVTIHSGFLAQTAELFEQPDMNDVGGIAGYDTRNYGQPVNLRWRIRAALGVVPPLDPGRIDRLGRSVPVSFARPFRGCRPVGYLYGFCMLYRRSAIGDLRFDETLPTYGGEDRDFSSRVGHNWKLILCGDLKLEHHCSPQSRDTVVQRTYQAGFGTGRSLGKNVSTFADYLEVARVLICEFFVDAAVCLRSPSRERMLTPFARAAGLVSGWRSLLKNAGGAA